MEWLIWTIYFLGVVPAWRVMFVQAMKILKKDSYYNHDEEFYHDNNERMFGAFMSGLMAWLWPLSPLVLVGWLVIKTPTPDERKAIKKKEQEEHEREMRRVAREIEDQRRELEAERIRVAGEYLKHTNGMSVEEIDRHARLITNNIFPDGILKEEY